MSVTFSVEGLAEEDGYELPCPACGVSLLAGLDPAETRHHGCPACLGYGGPEELPQPRHELNVHNGNAQALLTALGFVWSQEGGADPRDLLVALELRGGLPPVARYRAILERIARRAVRLDRRVLWS